MEVMPKVVHSIRDEMRSGREHLTVPQFRILGAISRGLNHNKEICELLGVSEAASSRMIDHLVQEGYIQKKTNTADKRQSDLSLTPKGDKFNTVVRKDAKKRIEAKLQTLSEEEQFKVVEALKILQKTSLFLRK